MQSSDPRERREMLRIFGPVVLLVLLAFAVAYQFIKPAPPERVVMATGVPAGAYHDYAQRYGEVLAAQGIELVLRNTTGSVENQALLKAGEVDVAFVQGGSVHGDGSGLQALGSLYFEPLWLFHGAGPLLDRLDGLKGMRVAVGAEGSGTRELVLRLLADAGIANAGAQFIALGGRAAATALVQGELDAVFLVSGAESALVRDLLKEPGVNLASLARASAYTRRYRFLSELTLPEGAMDLAANLPPRRVRLLASAAGLIAGPELHPAISDLLLQAAGDIHGKGGWLETPGQFPSAAFTELPLSKEAHRYYKYGPPLLQRYLPHWAASLVDRLKVLLLPLIVVLLPFFKVMPLIYTWRMRARIYRWYRELERIDLAQHGSTDETRRGELDRDLAALENDVLKLEVPLAFASQLYHLRQHIDLVRSRVHA